VEPVAHFGLETAQFLKGAVVAAVGGPFVEADALDAFFVFGPDAG
jgi:hypothetical protein